jgi:diguanylate cyclase (GGDEF)-like protein
MRQLKRLFSTVIWRRLAKGEHQRSLVSRLLGLLMLGAVVVYLIVNVGLWWTSTRLIEDNLEKQASRWLAELDELGTPLYVSRVHKHLAAIDYRIKNFPEIAFIRYYDAKGEKILGEFGERTRIKVAPLTPVQLEKLAQIDSNAEKNYLLERVTGEETYLRFIYPIRVKSIRSDGLLSFDLESKHPEQVRVIGYIDLSLDPGYYKEQLVRSMASGSLVIAVLLILAMFVGRKLILGALKPLTDLQEPLARLARGEIDVKVERAKDKEISAIGDALNVTISALKQRDVTLRRLAEHDVLTGLVNRGLFMRDLEKEIEQAAQDSMESAVFFIDLDQFKYINDTLGHAAGDKLLVQVATLLKSRSRENDVVSRFGGDEFTILARNVSHLAAVEMAKSFNHIMRDVRLAEAGKTFSVNCSIGIAMIDSNKFTAEEVLSHADMACYSAKLHGRNRYHMYEPGDESKKQMVSDIGWFELIKTTIALDRFKLFYQPIIDVISPGKEGYEVLLRLPGEGSEFIPPAAFLPVATRFGLMVEIDRWVIAHALKALGEFRKAGRDVTLSINLSGQTLEDPSILTLIKESLERYDVPASSVIFEITEQSAVTHMEKAQQLIQGIVALGCRFALDDFGTGFSSFSYLKDLPVAFIKIDGAFVRNMATNAVDETMVASMIQIARSLGKLTVAEYVQDDKTIAMLRASGVDYLQGFHVGIPAERLPTVLRAVPGKKKSAS